MLVLGDSFAGKKSLIYALAGAYVADATGISGVNAVDVHSLHIAPDDKFSFTTDENPESLRVWILAANKFYSALHQSLIKKDSLTLVVLDGGRPERAPFAIKHWSGICKSWGLTNVLTVFTKADQKDITAEIRSTIDNCFFVSTKHDSEQLQLLRSTIVSRVAQSAEVPDQESELLINAVKILTQIDNLGCPRVAVAAALERLPYEDLAYGIIHPEIFRELLREYSLFLFTDLAVLPLVQGCCRMCSAQGVISPEVGQKMFKLGQCLNVRHHSPHSNRLNLGSFYNNGIDGLEELKECFLDVQFEKLRHFDETCDLLLQELVVRRILYPMKLEDGQDGYAFPQIAYDNHLPEPIVRGIKVTYTDPTPSIVELVDDVLNQILTHHQLVWTASTKFNSYGSMKAQFSVQGVDEPIKLFEYDSYVILDLPPPLQVENILGPRFQWVEGVKPKYGGGGSTSEEWKLIHDSYW